jgi:uncharacterized damage-inducible protein DinB
MHFDFATALPILERTPGVLRTALEQLPSDWTDHPYGTNPDGSPTWSVRDIVAHLIHTDRTDWMVRAHHILRHGDSLKLPPFDRYGHMPLAERHDVAGLLGIFAAERASKLAELQALNLTTQDLGRPGMHPALGNVTLGQLLSTWVVHDLNHTSQICKAMAFQYHKEVGVWSQYLSILSPPAPR